MNIEDVMEVHRIRGILREYITVLLTPEEMVKKLGLPAIIIVPAKIRIQIIVREIQTVILGIQGQAIGREAGGLVAYESRKIEAIC